MNAPHLLPDGRVARFPNARFFVEGEWPQTGPRQLARVREYVEGVYRTKPHYEARCPLCGGVARSRQRRMAARRQSYGQHIERHRRLPLRAWSKATDAMLRGEVFVEAVWT